MLVEQERVGLADEVSVGRRELVVEDRFEHLVQRVAADADALRDLGERHRVGRFLDDRERGGDDPERLLLRSAGHQARPADDRGEMVADERDELGRRRRRSRARGNRGGDRGTRRSGEPRARRSRTPSAALDDVPAELVLHVLHVIVADPDTRGERRVVAPVVRIEPHLVDRVELVRDRVAVGRTRRSRSRAAPPSGVVDPVDAELPQRVGAVVAPDDVPLRLPAADRVGVERAGLPVVAEPHGRRGRGSPGRAPRPGSGRRARSAVRARRPRRRARREPARRRSRRRRLRRPPRSAPAARRR